ncbi:hypothetical protein [Fodinibius sp. Rm-B-1B1-1]|uniref:hypothetical protein n=1 Tax=Fodinibius alkaliphilus TaxID=3140241 RepID=UPI00315A3ECF
MNLNKPGKIILGILTFLPLLFAVSILGLIIFNFFSMFFTQEPAMPLMYFSYLGYILPYIFPAILLSLGLFVFYIVHLVQNSSLDTEKRILWSVVMFLVFGVATPIYWYFHIWKKDSKNDVQFTPSADKNHEPRTNS